MKMQAYGCQAHTLADCTDLALVHGNVSFACNVAQLYTSGLSAMSHQTLFPFHTLLVRVLFPTASNMDDYQSCTPVNMFYLCRDFYNRKLVVSYICLEISNPPLLYDRFDYFSQMTTNMRMTVPFYEAHSNTLKMNGYFNQFFPACCVSHNHKHGQ